MIHKRARERRIHDSGPPSGYAERRYMTKHRKMEIPNTTCDDFERLMAALGFRHTEAEAVKT
jgi:hypothetical protein